MFLITLYRKFIIVSYSVGVQSVCHLSQVRYNYENIINLQYSVIRNIYSSYKITSFLCFLFATQLALIF
jgi:hypothetical protein